MGSGRHKLLLLLDGRPVLAHVIEATLASQARPVIVVLGHQADLVRSHIHSYLTHPDIILVNNTDYLQGMSTSMHMGIQVFTTGNSEKPAFSHLVDSTLIILGDQPMITSRVIDALIMTYRMTGKRIIAPRYDGKRGSPVLFDASLFSELMKVTGDEGGRTVLERHSQEVELIEVGDALANYDVDTWEAYQQVVEIWEHKKGG
jgi:molybdenum cofactor cytidylyltransferase